MTESQPAEPADSTPGWPARLAFAAALAAYMGLIALLLAWVVWLDPPPTTLISPVLLILIGPLLLPLRGLLHARRYTLAWSTLLILAYFIHGILYAAGNGWSVWLGSAEIALSLAYFGAANGYMRLSRARRAPRE